MVAAQEARVASEADFELRIRRAYHEVKSPTALMITVARAALEQNDLARARSALELIERIGERALTRTATVLSVGAPDSGRSPIGFLRDLAVDADRCGVGVTLNVEDGARFARIERDPGAFEALAQGLLENAQFHGDSNTPIELRLSLVGSQLEFMVTNRCAQEDRHAGQRIGLHLAEDLAGRMGGALEARSRAGSFEVRVTVPAMVSEA